MRLTATVGALILGLGAGGGAAQQPPKSQQPPKPPMSWSDFRDLGRVEPDHRIRWGDGEESFGELYLPEGPGPHPVAIVIHGGCWRAIADLGYVSHLARALADDGWAAWSLEFRRVDQPDGAWPAILEDVAAGTDYLRALADRYALDPTRVVTVGHSSGGHLALWLASRPSLPADPPTGPALRGDDPLPVVGVVGLGAIADLEDFDRRGGGGCGPAAVTELLGAEPTDAPGRLALASPRGRLPLAVPQLLITGALDETVPAAHAAAWAEAARAAGDDTELIVPEGAGHFEVVAPWTAPFHSLRPVLRSFLDRLRFERGRGMP